MSEERIALIERVLIEEGAANTGTGGGLHSWRCDYPERYGPCTCVRDTAVRIDEALRPD